MPSRLELPPHLCRKMRDEHTRDKFYNITGKSVDNKFEVSKNDIFLCTWISLSQLDIVIIIIFLTPQHIHSLLTFLPKDFANSGRVTTTACGANYCRHVTVPPPTYRWEINHYTVDYIPYSLWTVCGFFNIPQNLYVLGLWDGAHGLSFLSEQTRKSYHFADNNVFTKAVLSSQLFKDPVWVLVLVWGLNQQPPTRQTSAYLTELTRRQFNAWTHCIKFCALKVQGGQNDLDG